MNSPQLDRMSAHSLVTLSIVSHGQGSMIRQLLGDIALGTDFSYDVILTLNVPEDERFLQEFGHLPIRVVRNERPKGFGANHNAAFRISTSPWFAVVNPDIRARPFRLLKLLSVSSGGNVGAVAPLVTSPSGAVEDSARKFPTFIRLGERIVARMLRRRPTPDYSPSETPLSVEWVAGMFVLYPRRVYAEIGGFDERYFMYCEDADICRRIRRTGLDVLLVPGVRVVHDAQRASRRRAQHLKWHLRSTIRFLTGF